MPQSKLPEELRGNSPRTIEDLVIGDYAFVHVDNLCVDSEWGMWIRGDAVIHTQIRENWNGIYLVVCPIAGAIEVDIRAIYGKWKYIRTQTPDAFKRMGFIPCVIAEIDHA